jgi:hypothetical protein
MIQNLTKVEADFLDFWRKVMNLWKTVIKPSYFENLNFELVFFVIENSIK